jgi:hypothetical protein
MPDRAIISLLPALSAGFICGIIASALILGAGGTLAVGIAGGLLVAAAAGSSVFGVRGDTGEKAIVSALRAACAVALFACVYLFILGFLRDGKPVVALVWLVLGGCFAGVITRLRVRERGESNESAAET